ncbi:Protein of unknown function [Gryllus bimaculatus]|nr:Protein of unknown function [Gryllus bimaculatus]
MRTVIGRMWCRGDGGAGNNSVVILEVEPACGKGRGGGGGGKGQKRMWWRGARLSIDPHGGRAIYTRASDRGKVLS